MFLERVAVDVVANVIGTGSGQTVPVTGRVLGVRYIKTDYADTVDVAITSARDGRTIWAENNVTADRTLSPLAAANGTDGSTLLSTYAPVPVVNEGILVAVTNGGSNTTGRFEFLIG